MIKDYFPGVRGVILDMDGVLWRDATPIGNLPVIFDHMHAAGLKVLMATNNATRTVHQFQQKLAGFGVSVSPDQIINSSLAVGYFLKKKNPTGGPVYVIGEQSLKDDLSTYGFDATGENENVLAVVAGLDRNFTFAKLCSATLLIRKGIPFIGTNPDRTFPTKEGLVPGAGSILAAIEAATDTPPIIVGKPEPFLYELGLDRLGTTPEETLVVGDRLETDISGAQKMGCKTALVLSGVTTVEQARNWTPRPDIICNDLASLVG